jgi:hypothetical protein
VLTVSHAQKSRHRGGRSIQPTDPARNRTDQVAFADLVELDVEANIYVIGKALAGQTSTSGREFPWTFAAKLSERSPRSFRGRQAQQRHRRVLDDQVILRRRPAALLDRQTSSSSG